MKKEIKPDFMWHLNDVIIAFQITIVTTVNEKGQVNAAPFGLAFPFCSSPEKPQMLLCSNNVWHTSQNIEATGEFVLNYASYALRKKVVQTGLMFAEGVNELEQAGLTAIPAHAVRPPRIDECFQHIECRLNHIIRPSEHQNNFVGDILSISANGDLLLRTRDKILKTADPLFLFGMDITTMEGNYARLGETTTYAPSKQQVE